VLSLPERVLRSASALAGGTTGLVLEGLPCRESDFWFFGAAMSIYGLAIYKTSDLVGGIRA